MDILRKEIERKKRQMQEKNVLEPDKKYFKRGEAQKKEVEEILKKRTKQEAEGSPYFSGLGTDESSQDSSAEVVNAAERKIPLSRKEVIRRLRERREPIRLFGEDDYESFQRLKKHEMQEPEVKGFQNDFRDAMDQVDQESLEEILRTDQTVTDVKVRDDGTTYEEIMKMGEKLGKGDEASDSHVLLKFMKLVLNMWGDELNRRPNDVKQSMKGKVASATHVQTVSYMKPLFRKLKQEDMSRDILECLVDIVKHLLNRDYLKANEAYLEMAIGNAPWPIGVTMVGIHARTGREKIFAKNVAHVLNDETQRKYIQGLKRLMTQAQKYFPTEPSRSVNFEPTSKMTS